MKRSDFLIRFTFVLALAAIVIYIGYALYYSQVNPLRTVSAATGYVTETAPTVGYAVREETVIASGVQDAVVVIEDGTKVAVGGKLAVRYLTGDSVERAAEIRETELRIAQLEALSSASTDEGAAVLARESARTVATMAANGTFSDIDAVCADVSAYIFAGGESYTPEELEEELTIARARLKRLTGASGSDTVSISAQVSGVFSTSVDGFENIGPEMLEGLTPHALVALFKDSSGDDGAGKVITGLRWYYASAMKTDQARKLEIGQKKELTFTGDYNGTLEMRVESIGTDSGGSCVVVFSCGKAIRDVAGARELEAEVNFGTISGMMIPKEAMHVDENGKQYIYVVSGLQARRVDVGILAEKDGCYITSYERGGLLTEGAEIITKANGLYDGKVVR